MSDLPDLSNLEQNQLIRLLLERLAVTPTETVQPIQVPTFDDYLDKIAGVVSAGTLRANEPYWNRIKTIWGKRRINERVRFSLSDFLDLGYAARSYWCW